MVWTYKTFTPAVIVQKYGWPKVIVHKLLDAQERAIRDGIPYLSEPTETVTTSWHIGDDGSYIPQVADGTETYYGIAFTFNVDKPGQP